MVALILFLNLYPGAVYWGKLRYIFKCWRGTHDYIVGSAEHKPTKIESKTALLDPKLILGKISLVTLMTLSPPWLDKIPIEFAGHEKLLTLLLVLGIISLFFNYFFIVNYYTMRNVLLETTLDDNLKIDLFTKIKKYIKFADSFRTYNFVFVISAILYWGINRLQYNFYKFYHFDIGHLAVIAIMVCYYLAIIIQTTSILDD